MGQQDRVALKIIKKADPRQLIHWLIPLCLVICFNYLVKEFPFYCLEVLSYKKPELYSTKYKNEMFMLKYIHSNAKFEKRFNTLKKSEKMAVSAAKKAEDIITNIMNNGEVPLSILGKFTKHGEARIKNCIKFDIGKGHRLVCVKEKEHLFLLFIGTHDDCDAWIENNRSFTPDSGNKHNISYEIVTSVEDRIDTISEGLMEADYEDVLLEKITDKDLQYVFRGLTS